MHELGLITGVVESVTRVARANGATKVLKVSLSVGEMTEAIEDSLHFAYDVMSEYDPLLSGSELEVTMVKPKSRCTSCGLEFEHDRFHMTCPECGSFAELIAGRELSIDHIEVNIPDEDEVVESGA